MNTSETPTPIADRARRFAPVVWLLGKVQSGKTSIIRELTQASDAEIGSGFEAARRRRACSIFPPRRRSSAFSIRAGWARSPTTPARTSPSARTARTCCWRSSKALDFEQQAVLDVIRAVRTRHPDWPVVVAQTTPARRLPAAGAGHVLPYPFGTRGCDVRYRSRLVRALAPPAVAVCDIARPRRDNLRAHRLHRSRATASSPPTMAARR